eukprot:UN05413
MVVYYGSILWDIPISIYDQIKNHHLMYHLFVHIVVVLQYVVVVDFSCLVW